MKNYKKTLAGILALSMTLGVASCGKSGGSDSAASSDESFEVTENVEVQQSTDVTPIPDGAEKTLIYLGENDINPTKANPEKSTEITLFEQQGGKVEFKSTTNEKRFDDLAMLIQANKDVPDMFKYEWLAFPSQVVRDMYQPIDDIVDFDSDLWSGVKNTADQYTLNGKHYVAPLSFAASAMLCYDRDVIDSEGLDAPYDLYLNGEWNFSAFHDIMADYVNNAPADTTRYGANGFFYQHIVQQTGKTFVTYDPEKNEYASNLMDPDIENAEDFLYNLRKEGLLLDGWIGSAGDCFNQNCLFYGMGIWAYTGKTLGPKEEDHWEVVPMPQYDSNPQKITTSDMIAYMWVKGSTKNDAMKTWFECNRVAQLKPEYQEAGKEKFLENNPYWTEDMYQVTVDVVSDDYLMLFDYAFGVSSALGDRKQFDGNQCLVDYLYKGATVPDENGNQKTWASIREEYGPTVDSNIKELNQKVKDYKG